VQSGGWGSTSAAPIVRDVVKAYYDKKNMHMQQATAENGTPPTAPRPLVATVGAQHQ
jgi:hypothetical protein